MFDQNTSWLIDPAVYCGDPEADLAMTEMFGGFGDSFYRAYDEVRPRSKEYPRKRDIYNLYHYLNHYNLFGCAYQEACKKRFNRITTL
jgi:fructosamine-3-kinase